MAILAKCRKPIFHQKPPLRWVLNANKKEDKQYEIDMPNGNLRVREGFWLPVPTCWYCQRKVLALEV